MRIEVHGRPVPKARPRMSRDGGVFTPKTTLAFEKKVARAAVAAGVKPIEGAVSVDITSVFPMPKDWSKKLKAASDGQPRLSTPDTDNLAKSVLDGLNGVAFIDDRTVYQITARKIWSSDCGDGKTIVIIS